MAIPSVMALNSAAQCRPLKLPVKSYIEKDVTIIPVIAVK
jgi:hypothetical protein